MATAEEEAEKAARQWQRVSKTREAARILEDQLATKWRWGQNVIMAWQRTELGLDIWLAPHHRLPAAYANFPHVLIGARGKSPTAVLAPLLGGDKVDTLIGDFDTLTDAQIERIVKRYTVTLTDFRAAARFVIDDYHCCSPMERLSLQNSLSTSINIAQYYLGQKGYDVDLARTNTDAGFTIWNRNQGYQADAYLLCLTIIAVAHDILDRRASGKENRPGLKIAFTVGETLDLYQPQGATPTLDGFIQGQLLIDLETMINHAQAGQLLIGMYHRPHVDGPIEVGKNYSMVDAVRMVAEVQVLLDRLQGMKLAGQTITSIASYLTGRSMGGGAFDVRQYILDSLVDREGELAVFNMKANIYQGQDKPIFAGLQDKEVDIVGAKERPFDPSQYKKQIYRRAGDDE